ncbi:MAG TPA: hypothetical protein VGG19_01125 [Tepidisphaeraceae bacterium]|jgi:hypothetical protein
MSQYLWYNQAMLTSPARLPRLDEDINLSERLSRMQGQEIGPSDVVKVLQNGGVKHVLVGAHAISAWAGDPRATIDVDLIASRPAQAKKVLSAAFPHLTVEEHPVVIRFKMNGREAIDVIRPTSSAIFKAALKHSVKVKIAGVLADAPQLEMALALKFAAMISITRQIKDKYQDAHDFIAMVQHNSRIDLSKIEAFGELVYSGGAKEILKLVEDAKAGRRLEF